MPADAVFSVSLLTCAYFMRRGFIIMAKYICTNYTISRCSYDSHSNKRTPLPLLHIKLIKQCIVYTVYCRRHNVFIPIQSAHVFLSSIWHLFVKMRLRDTRKKYKYYKYLLCFVLVKPISIHISYHPINFANSLEC